MNEYVATAAAEKRLREVLAAKLPYPTDADAIAELLLSGEVGIEYKPRAKAVLITLPLPDKAPSKLLRKDGSDPLITAPDGTKIVEPEGVTVDPEEYKEAVAWHQNNEVPCPPFETVRLDATPVPEPEGSRAALVAPADRAEEITRQYLAPSIGTFVPKPEPDNGYGVSFDDVYNVG